MASDVRNQYWIDRVHTLAKKVGGNIVLDVEDIEALVAEILAEANRPIKERSFDFDIALLREDARKHMAEQNLTYLQVSRGTGLTVNALKQHLGDEPPKSMGLNVAVALMAWMGSFDLLRYLLEERND